MAPLRLFSDSVYLVEFEGPTLSGSSLWQSSLAIASGRTIRARLGARRHVVRCLDSEADLAVSDVPCRLDDGHLPEFQPRVTFGTACRWVLAEPGRWAWRV